MVPKLDRSSRYTSKTEFSSHCLLAMKRLLKAIVGQVMRQKKGKYIRQSTPAVRKGVKGELCQAHPAPNSVETESFWQRAEASFGSDAALCSILWQYVKRTLSSCFFAHFSLMSLPHYAAQCQ